MHSFAKISNFLHIMLMIKALLHYMTKLPLTSYKVWKCLAFKMTVLIE